MNSRYCRHWNVPESAMACVVPTWLCWFFPCMERIQNGQLSWFCLFAGLAAKDTVSTGMDGSQ